MRPFLSLPLLLLVACGGDPQAATPEAVAAAPEEAASAPAEDWAHYGDAFTVDEVLAAGAVLADPGSFTGHPVRVEGRVTDVCQKAGCWMVIADEDKHMRVIMKDHAFSVAKDGTGATCQVQGEIVAKAVDPETLAHLKSESSEGAVIPEEEAGGDTVYELVATGVSMKKPVEG